MPPAFSVVRVHLLPCVHMSAWYWVQGCCSELGFLSSILADPSRPRHKPTLALHATLGTAAVRGPP